MIIVFAAIGILPFVFVLAFGIRTRQPLAIVASVSLLVMYYCVYGWAMAGLMAHDQLAAYTYLSVALLSLLLAGLLTYVAWRRASSAARASLGERRSRTP